MSRSYRTLAFTPEVLHAQVTYGSRSALERLERVRIGTGDAPAAPGADGAPDPRARDELGDDERAFIAAADEFYLATVSETGWPYVQLRGGPPGFVTTPDEHTIAWPDFRGNRQYISTGHLAHDDRVALIFIDHARQARLKVYGHARAADLSRTAPTAVSESVGLYRATVEREVRVDVAAHDWNCPQHITARYSAEELAPVLEQLRRRVADLERENARLRGGQYRRPVTDQ